MKILLRSGEFDVRVKDNFGNTALHYAASHTNNPELIHLILAAEHGMSCLNAGGNGEYVEDALSYQIFNPNSGEWSNTGTIDITIYGVNDPPIISGINDQIMYEDSSLVIFIEVGDEVVINTNDSSYVEKAKK